MNISHLFRFTKEDIKHLFTAFVIVSLFGSTFVVVEQTLAATGAVTLSVSVQTSLTFTIPDTGAAAFGNLTPGTPKYSTSTLSVLTNNTPGYVISLSGDYKNSTNNNLQLTGATSTQISDQTEWVPGAATTTAGNAVVLGSLVNSGNVLAFRVMSASSTNGVPLLSTSWWGANDAAGALWAGIASTTVQRTIGNAGVGSYHASAHLNTVQYYLNVSPSQPTGSYTAPLTFTATAN